ncbi:ABC-type proline/glycine betaine transport system, permease component [Sanguibacter keddieii DSM 10542]|uniref:ABC-type proline/glycine betaine transport system, permease component n=1 Tax=Sanguibacter keddieii (strain ATCC 51767 / DSM 10542 / NCFB 3025 / ST-74) TaxID=446469 RepID=D1BC89_SANKS|nr:proline/glycine betaine ABC transporter permease [Sanguibacter keddieii]ACZ20869.1 ABC-type proline/glycine betaine transport system, permease component [Sanguibacter keddieii DSM 10542]
MIIAADTQSGLPRAPLGEWVDSFVGWVTSTFSWFFDLIKGVLTWFFDQLDTILSGPPFWVVALVLAGLAFWARGWKLGLGAFVGFAVIDMVGQWGNAMDTLALVLIASAIALIIAIPLGIWAARNDAVSHLLRPVLDFMQTMPAFVYLIPTVVIFLTGEVPGIVATVIFALAPGVRFTELGIRQVDREVVEAGHAFGATEGRIMRQIQLPLALPTIMAGINQVIMLSLSMVVIAGMVGAAGLGSDVVRALQRVNISLGFEAGLAVVILAMFLDRVTSALGDRAPVAKALKTTSA